MAIHFNYIKGLNGDVTSLGADDLYTYIKWSKGSARSSEGHISSDHGYLPKIIVSTKNYLDVTSNGTTQCDLGHIITSNATNQTINENLYITNRKQIRFCNTSFKDGEEPEERENRYFGTINWSEVTNEDSTTYKLAITSHKNLTIGAAQTDGHITIGSNSTGNVPKLDIKADTTQFMGKISIGSISTNMVNIESGSITTTGKITASQEVEALFFNATSDQRAKSHIQLFKSNALDIVNKLPIYEFHYRNNDTPSIGVLAQDAVFFDDQFTDFSLVDNPNATGEDGDFMTIKESKLVYILWKAVQEQQEQINILQEQLNKLKESL